MTTREYDHRNEQPAELITGALSDARDLAVAEVDKLKAETVNQVKSVGQEVKIVGVGALIFTVAAIMLGTAVSLGVAALGLPAWAAFAIVAVVFGAIGYLFINQRRSLAKTA